VVKAVNTKGNNPWKITGVLLLRKLHAGYQNCQPFHQLYITERTVSAEDTLLTKRFWEFLYVFIYKSGTGFPKKLSHIMYVLKSTLQIQDTSLYNKKKTDILIALKHTRIAPHKPHNCTLSTEFHPHGS
jgi:hypothetical protein